LLDFADLEFDGGGEFAADLAEGGYLAGKLGVGELGRGGAGGVLCPGRIEYSDDAIAQCFAWPVEWPRSFVEFADRSIEGSRFVRGEVAVFPSALRSWQEIVAVRLAFARTRHHPLVP
jgi:hypothetical protein